MAAFVQCAACGRALDPLRAGQVAIVGGRFVYFCDRECKQRFGSARPSLEGQTLEPPPVAAAVVVTPPPPPATPPSEPEALREPQPPPPQTPEEVREPARALPPVAPASAQPAPEPTPEPAPDRAPPSAPSPPARASVPDPPTERVSSEPAVAPPPPTPAAPAAIAPTAASDGSVAPVSTRVFVAVVSAAMVASFAPRTAIVIAAVLVAWGAVVLTSPHRARPLRELLPFGTLGALAAPLFLTILFVLGLVGHRVAALSAGRAAAIAASVVATVLYFVGHAERALARTRDAMRATLVGDAAIVRGGETTSLEAERVRPGDRVRAVSGERVLVDAVVAQGAATVRPWPFAKYTESRRAGDAVVAGAEVVSGELLLDTTWASAERALSRALDQPAQRPELADRTRRLSLPITVAVACAGGLAAAASDVASWFEGAIVLGAALAALPATLGAAVGSVAVARAATGAISRGIFFRDAAAFELVGRLERVAVCSGSSLLLGEPEVVDVVSVGATPPAEVLAWAAAAEAGAVDANGRALVRAAQRSAQPSLRTVTRHPGLGVTAQSATGDRIVVGSRRLAMNEAVSIALAEGRITELEKKGRVVVLVAAAERLLGFVALQDGLRPDARATVQRLLAAGVEPVMLTGAARATAETLAAALAIEHVRPEVAPDDRGAEVRALATSAAGVGVIGHPRLDDAALGAATASIALSSAGAAPGEWSVALACDRASTGAEAVAIARSARDVVRSAVLVSAVPGLVVTLALGAGLLPPVWAWIAPMVGGLAVAAATRRVRLLASPDSPGPDAES